MARSWWCVTLAFSFTVGCSVDHAATWEPTGTPSLDPFPEADLVFQLNDHPSGWQAPAYPLSRSAWCGEPQAWESRSTGLVSASDMQVALPRIQHPLLDALALDDAHGDASITVVLGPDGRPQAVRARVAPSEEVGVPEATLAAMLRAACLGGIATMPGGRWIYEVQAFY